ncbi:hypothetical protein KAF44_25765 (plasmid) [Cupriavidus necator]|nr:hypothetical protein KAF44_25765 [Cupriavidus necator]
MNKLKSLDGLFAGRHVDREVIILSTGCEFRLKRSGGGQRNWQAGETSRVEMGDEAVLRCHGCISAGEDERDHGALRRTEAWTLTASSTTAIVP